MLRKLCSIGVADELNRFNAFYAQAQRLHHSVATASPLSGQRFNLSCRTTVAIDQEPARHDESSDSDKALLMSAERMMVAQSVGGLPVQRIELGCRLQAIDRTSFNGGQHFIHLLYLFRRHAALVQV